MKYETVSTEAGQLATDLASLRDLFPAPAPGTDLESKWAAAMADPGCVLDYVKACLGGELTPGMLDSLRERQRQIHVEGWDAEHDAKHPEGELAEAGVCYAISVVDSSQHCSSLWPWAHDWWKPGTKRQNLIKGVALLMAELDRHDRKVQNGEN